MRVNISDEELLSELKKRFENNKKTLDEQAILMTQLKAVNEKLLLSELLKSNFLSNIRNEINNPIASILELSKIISEENLDIDLTKKFSKLIYNEIFSLDFQLRNILLSAEIEAGETTFSVVSLNVASIIENVIGNFSHQIAKKQINLVTNNCIEKDTKFYTDSEKLHLIISNILSNAIQFSNEGGTIVVDSKIENNQLVVSVNDNGLGIRNEHKSIIFDRFKQIEEGSTKTYGGHGLGLTITKALLEIINGEIIFESEIGKGSTFTVVVNNFQVIENEDEIFSSDGNDFLFSDVDHLIF